MLTCREAIERLGELVDGGLRPFVRGAVLRHLARCRDCELYLDGYLRTIELARADSRAEPVSYSGERFPERLVRSVLAAGRGSAGALWHLLAAVAASPLLFFSFGAGTRPF